MQFPPGPLEDMEGDDLSEGLPHACGADVGAGPPPDGFGGATSGLAVLLWGANEGAGPPPDGFGGATSDLAFLLWLQPIVAVNFGSALQLFLLHRCCTVVGLQGQEQEHEHEQIRNILNMAGDQLHAANPSPAHML